MTPTPLSQSSSAWRGTRAALSTFALGAALLVALPDTAHADPDDVDIDELTERAEELEEAYDGELLQFTEIKERVEEAEEDLTDIEERLEESRGDVSAIASARYRDDGGFDPALQIVFDSEPEDMFADAATVTYLGESQAEQISELVETRDEAEEVTEELNEELSEASELVDDLEEQKDEVEERIAEYEEEQIPDTPGDGTIPSDAQGPGWDQVTPRMAAIRDDIVQEFGAPYPVGCYRPSADDHGDGRACDFMMSANGGYPTDENKALGDQIAEYAVANADRLGIDYIIWEQEIWHSGNRTWTWMNDRGDPTQNHYDHVHVSSHS